MKKIVFQLVHLVVGGFLAIYQMELLINWKKYWSFDFELISNYMCEKSRKEGLEQNYKTVIII